MYTPLARCEEYAPPRPTRAAAIPARLEPVDYRILTLLFQGLKSSKIATKLQMPLREVITRQDRFAFRRLQAEVEAGVVKSILQASTTEPAVLAKAAAPSAMRSVVKLSATCPDYRTKLQASKAVLSYAGVEPPTRIEVTTPERILDQMTAEELARFAERRVWPERFRDLLRAFLPALPPPPGSSLIDVTPTPIPPEPPEQEEPPADERSVGAATAYDPSPPTSSD